MFKKAQKYIADELHSIILHFYRSSTFFTSMRSDFPRKKSRFPVLK